jgi:hypothetical protein
MGDPMVLFAFTWALVADGAKPTLTVHGSNNPSFFTDMTADVSRTAHDGVRALNSHVLAFDAHLLWQLHFPFSGYLWTPEDVADWAVDAYLTHTGPGAHYAQVFPDGSIDNYPFLDFDNTGHVFPDDTVVANPPAYRYYALTISVGAVTSGTTPTSHVVELQEWWPLVQQPDSILPQTDTDAAIVYGRTRLCATEGLYRIRLTKSVSPGASFGYMELWDNFRTPAVLYNGGGWSSRAFSVANNNANRRRATVTLVDVVVPRMAKIRSLNATIITMPFLMCFVRHPSIFNSEDQACMGLQPFANGLLDIDESRRPPGWVLHRDTMMFTLMVPNARIPGACPFMGLPSNVSARVMVTGNVFAAFPECCVVLPNGEMLDLVAYDDSDTHLPMEVANDEMTGINVMMSVQFEEPAFKRAR